VISQNRLNKKSPKRLFTYLIFNKSIISLSSNLVNSLPIKKRLSDFFRIWATQLFDILSQSQKVDQFCHL